MPGNVAVSGWCKIRTFAERRLDASLPYGTALVVWKWEFTWRSGSAGSAGGYGQPESRQAAPYTVSVQFRKQIFKFKKEILLSTASLPWLSGSF